MFRSRNSQYHLMFVFLVLLSLGARKVSTEWINCSVSDEHGFVGTAFPFKGGMLTFQYLHTDVTPVHIVYSINGMTQYVHSVSVKESLDESSQYLEESIPLTIEQQGALGIGTHIFLINMTFSGAEYLCKKEIQLLKDVTGVSVSVNKRFVATQEKFKLLVNVATGFPCTIECLVLDSYGVLVSKEETFVDSNPSSKSFLFMLTSTVPGNNTVYVAVSNALFNETASTRIIVEEPITDVTLTSDSPARYPSNTINFEVTVEDSSPLSALSYDVSYGDGIVEYDVPLSPGVNSTNFNHTYHSPGLYTCHVMVQNRVSHEEASVKVGILEDIRNVSLLAYTWQNQYSQPQLILPLEYPVKFIADYEAGTIEYTTWQNKTMTINTTLTKFWTRFPAVGWYNFTAIVGNTFTMESETIQVNILESVTSLFLVNDGPVQLGDNITYVMFCKQQGSSPSYRVDFGDGTELNLPVPQKNPNVTELLPENLKIPFNPKKYFSTVFSHLYVEEGRYIATAIGWNLVSHVTSTYEAFIQLKPCKIPDIHIRDGGSNYDSVTKYKRSKAFIFAAKVDLDCQDAKKADYQWRIFLVDDIFSVPSAANEFLLPNQVKTKVTDLYIPKYQFDYGRYICELNVVMIMEDGTIGVSSRDQSFIEVAQTPLVAKIGGGSAVDIGWSSNITLDASESFDPDWEDEYDGEYHWYCHLNNESLPTDFEVTEVLPKTGGCLGDGIHLQSGNDSILFIEAETLHSNQSYVFHLAVSKPGRASTGWAMQTVTVLPGNLPTLALQCLQNCGILMNPSEKFALVGMCTDCKRHNKNKYTWTISSDDPIQDHLVGFRKVVRGHRKAFLSFPADTFAGLANYTVKLTIDSWSGASSRAEYTFTTNSPPTQGSCAVTPPEGVVMQTRFTIECDGFADLQGPLFYEAHAFTGSGSLESGKVSMVYYGVDPIFPPTLLPVGEADNDFNVTIEIKVSDSLGASVHTTTYVTVKEPAWDNQTEPVEDTALRLAQGNESQLSQLIAIGSMQSATQLVTSITSLLNMEAEKPSEEGEGEEDAGMRAEQQEKRKKARESLIDIMAQVEVRDMQSLEQTSAAIAQVTQQQQEVSMEAQLKAAEIYLGMGKFLKDQSDSDVGGQIVESSAKVLVLGLSNIMAATFSEMQLLSRQNDTSEILDKFTNETELEENARKARNVTKSVLSTLRDVQLAVLHYKFPGEEPTKLQTDSFTVSLARQERWQLDGLSFKSEEESFMFQLPEGMHELIGDDGDNKELDGVINSQMYHFKNSPFSWAPDNDQVTSEVIGLQFTRSDQSEIPLKNLPKTIDVYLPNPSSSSTPITPIIDPSNNDTLYAFNWTNSEASVIIQIGNDTTGDFQSDIQICIQYELSPNKTHYDRCKLLPEDKVNNFTNVSPYSWLLQPEDMTDLGTYYFTVERLQNSEDEHEDLLFAYQTQCIYWNKDDEKWKGDGCKVGPYTSLTHTHCQCNHLTFFALSLFVLPNVADLVLDIFFLSFLDNPVTVATVCAVFVGYVAVAIWARRKDKDEEQHAKVIYLRDNDPRSHYRYHITIFTGMRKNAGTSAIITLTLHGNFGSSLPHILSSKTQAILQRNSIDSFILTTRQSLGILDSVRVWHDNSGPSPDWYVSRILVHDLESDRWWYFLCRSWLAVDLGGSKIDKTFPAATEEDLNEFRNLVLSKSVRDLKDNHLWFSVVTKPPQSFFTRLQRATCCLQLLITSMTMNIIFFEVPENPKLQNLEFGSIQISLSTILVGIQASLMSIPISTLVETIFRNARPRYVAVPDPLQVQSSTSVAMMAHSMRGQFRRLTHRFSQTFHFGRRASGQFQQDVLEGFNSQSSMRTPSLTSLDLHKVQADLEWYTQELRSIRSSSDSTNDNTSMANKIMSYSNVLDAHRRGIQASDMEFQQSSELAAPSFMNMADAITDSVNSVSPQDFFDTETGLEDDVEWYRLDIGSPLPFSNIHNIRTTGHDSDNSEKLSYSEDQHKMTEDQNYEGYLIERINQCRQYICSMPSEEFSSEDGRQKAIRKLDLIMKLQGYEIESDEASKAEEEEEKEDFSHYGCLPQWCVYIAWFLAFGNCVVCAYFIIDYGLRYSWQTSMDWLVSTVVSIIQSVVIVHPIKVVILAAAFAIFLKTHELDDVGAQFFRNWKLPKISSDDTEETVEAIQRYNHIRAKNLILYNPPPASSVVKARERRRIAAKVHSMFRAFIGQAIFVFFVLEIAYTQQNIDSFYLGKSMRDKYRGIDKVSEPGDFYDWMTNFTVETYIDDLSHVVMDSNKLIGSVRLRQIRVKPNVCKVPPEFKASFSTCKRPLKKNSIDRGSYGPAWAYKSTKKNSNDPWDYQSCGNAPGSYYHVASMGYDTGGFIVNLGLTSQSAARILSDLKANIWINENTWAVFVEWTMYNANINLFSINAVLFEVDTIGNLDGFSDFSIVRLHRYTSPYDIFVRVLEGTYIVVVMAMIYRDYRKWRNLGSDYFDFWNWLNLVIISSSICAIGFYVLRHSLGLKAMDRYHEDRNQFVSFSQVAFINQLVIQFISLIVFCATLKCAKVLRYNNSIFMLQQAMRNVSKQFFSFTLGILVAIMCFVAYAFLEFGRTLIEFRTLMASLQTLFIGITGGLDNLTNVVEEFPIQSFFFFIALCFFGIFVLFQLYVSFILAAFKEARGHPREYEDHDVVTVIVDWFIDRFAVH